MLPLHARRRRSPGVFSQQAPPPQAPDRAGARELALSLTSQPGLRLAPWQGRRRYTAGYLTPQRFTRAPASPNNQLAIAFAAGQINAKRATGKTRGLAPGRD